MGKFIDLTGKKFGRLTVINKNGYSSGKITWACLCECGNKSIVRGSHLQSGATKSCGCIIYESHNKTHGMSDTAEYQAWRDIKIRCYNRNTSFWHNYGGRGITMCDRWRNSFESFLEDMGERPTPNHSVDRLDNNKGYSPDNCAWRTAKEQSNNTRNNTLVTYKGRTQTITQWAEEIGIKYVTLRYRIFAGWSIQKAFYTPVK